LAVTGPPDISWHAPQSPFDAVKKAHWRQDRAGSGAISLNRSIRRFDFWRDVSVSAS
jgi:hypothetical protein